jgi:hypothetical protein
MLASPPPSFVAEGQDWNWGEHIDGFEDSVCAEFDPNFFGVDELLEFGDRSGSLSQNGQDYLTGGHQGRLTGSCN